ncbi:MAG: hypothetical protein CSA19_00425 [Deltaproteobacteria bacterium]|nr:MAG: hypothetical protein CSA19_00425 [Deltaproteobacteria bacterium]
MQTGEIWRAIEAQGFEASVFVFLKHFPLPVFTSLCFLIVLFLSVVTLCDSMTSTAASLSVQRSDTKEAPNGLKIFWALLMSCLAFLSILASSSSTKDAIDLVQSTKMLPMMAGLPVLFIFVLLLVSAVLMFRTHNFHGKN